eukprot:COSAG02_NODE_1774_length_10973_cov_18.317914_1_plen_113_part_00
MPPKESNLGRSTSSRPGKKTNNRKRSRVASRSPPAALKQHHKSPIKVLEYEDGGRKMRWVDVTVVAYADLQQGGSQLIDPTDHLSTKTLPDAAVEDEEAQTTDTNDEQHVSA